MKKIKGILLFGILTLLGIGSSFGAGVNNSMSVFHIFGDSNAFLISAYGQSNSNTRQVKLANHFPSYFYGGTRDGGTTLFSYNSFVSPLLSTTYYLKYDLSISDGVGFGLTGYYLNTDNLYNSFQLFNQMSSGELGVFNINYNSGEDFSPLVFNSDYSYFTLVDNEVIYNGTPYGSFDFGNLKYCFYGINRDFSCVYTTDNGGYNFVHFNYNISDEYGYYFTGYLIQPLNSLNSYYGFEGTNTLIISTDSQDRIIYNIIDVYSDNIVSLSAGNVIDKGYIDIQSLSFINRYFFGNSVLGNFAEIYEDSGTYYFRSNLVQQYSSSATAYSTYCRENINGCLVKTGLVFESNEDVINISLLGNSNTPDLDQTYGNNTSNLYLNCLSENLPEYCFDSNGNLQIDFLQNCFSTYDSTNNQTYYFCNMGGLIQQVEFISNGSGVSVSSCLSGECSHIFGVYDDGYTEEFFESYLNSTGYFFACPYHYDNNLTIWPKLITTIGIDFALPINCLFAGINQGKSVFNFIDNSGHFLSSPLLNFEGENRELLYKFFDLILILGGVFLFGSIFKNFK